VTLKKKLIQILKDLEKLVRIEELDIYEVCQRAVKEHARMRALEEVRERLLEH
jgi:hypothetical protein